MSDLTVRINLDNAAFDEEPATEAARILRQAADLVYRGEGSAILRDLNGNRVGELRIERGNA